MDHEWTKPIRNMSEERRKAIWWVTRVQAFTAMLPKEVVDMKPENINERWIKVEKSKTSSSTRFIPLHPEIAGFVEFVHSCVLENLDSQNKDKVQAVSRTFNKLIRRQLDPAIKDPKKALYSWRSTFSNAMRRAGADQDMRRSILGHRVLGSLAHYEDGPEFFKKRKWIKTSDPRKAYPDLCEDDDMQ